MIHSAEEAREIIETCGRIEMSDRLPPREVYEANGYLAALQGPEMKALVEALENPYIEISGPKEKQAVEESLSQYRKAVNS